MLCQALRQQDLSQPVDMVNCLQRTALDVLGKAGFGFDFHVLEDINRDTESTALYNAVFSKVLDPFHALLAAITGEKRQLPPTR